MGRFTTRSIGSAAVAGMLMGSLVFVPTASADPDAVSKAQQDLARIEEESSAIDARFIQLQSQLDDANRDLKAADADLKSQGRKVSTLSKDLGQFAMLRYQTSGVDMTTRLLTSDDEADFLRQLATAQSVTDRANEQVQKLQLAQAELAALKDNAEATREKIAADKAEQATVSAQYRKKEEEARKVLERLTAEEKARLAEIERKKQQEAKKAAEAAAKRAQEQQQRADAERAAEEAGQAGQDRAAEQAQQDPSAEPSSSESTSSEADTTVAAEGGSGRASTAVSYALSQVGKSYVMGATGPSAYDCSGLMLAAYQKAGVSVPRTSQAQFGAGSQVSTSDLQPGDLVFYYSGITHVGMYIGDGQIVHAANPRTGVKVSPLNSMPLQGARRVG